MKWVKQNAASQFKAKYLKEDPPGHDANAMLGVCDSEYRRHLRLKKPEDDVADWPDGSFIGAAVKFTKIWECPFITEIREKMAPVHHWEFLIPDEFLIEAYIAGAMKRGLAPLGPIPPEKFPDHARRWLAVRTHWYGVIPSKAGARMMARAPNEPVN